MRQPIPLPPKGTYARDELRRRATELRAQQMSFTQIALTLGVKRGSVQHLIKTYYDRERSRRYAERHRRPCPRCGELMHGSHGIKNKDSPGLCARCARIRQTTGGIEWTPELVVETIRRFYDEVGRAPSAQDFTPKRVNGASYVRRMERKKAMGLPHSRIVVRLFGSWNAAIAAAGFKPNPAAKDTYF